MINRAAVLGALLVAVSLVVAYSPAFALEPGHCGSALVSVSVGGVVSISESAVEPCMLVSYYDVATSVTPSAAGYGGRGQSGGAGDALVRIVNPNHNDPDNLQNGTLCAYIYVFDDNEEMQACCGCPVTPDGMRTISVVNQLTSNWGVNKGNLAAGVIDIFSGQLDWVAPFPGAPPPRGVNVAGTSGLGCDPSGGLGSGTSEHAIVNSDLRAWTDHAESMVGLPSTIVPGLTTRVVSTSTDQFASVPSDPNHGTDIIESCGFLLRNGSGSGVCSCGAGDSQSLFRPHS
ncbi:MAG: hypothetical protein WA005_10575 [Candidatus Binataceae bacterium]